MLDRALGADAAVDTALELESGNGHGRGDGLVALALADGREALGRQLGGARIRLRSSGAELVAIGALAVALAALVLVPATGTGRGAETARSGPGTRGGRHGRRIDDLAGPVGATLSGFGQTQLHAPPLAAVAAASSANSGSASGHSPYGGGIASNGADDSSQGVSQTVGQAGSLAGTRAAGAAGSGEADGPRQRLGRRADGRVRRRRGG